jgi:hypothetical protein
MGHVRDRTNATLFLIDHDGRLAWTMDMSIDVLKQSYEIVGAKELGVSTLETHGVDRCSEEG